MTGDTLAERVVAAPPLSNATTAADRLAGLADALPDIARQGRVRDLLLALADHAPFLWGLIERDPGRLARLLDEAPEAAGARIVADQRAAGARVEGWPPDLDAVGRRLRANRAELALLVALADIGGAWPLESVTAALSDFAEASVRAGLDALLHAAADSGRFLPEDADDPQAGSGLVVLGLGKLGGRELNYSSDIDLVVFFDGERAPLKPGLEPSPFFSRLAQAMAKLLQERTADGYVHRVDYRLRPDPGSTPVAISLASAAVYYESAGQNWERAAFIKARPVAGDLAAGERFLAELTPFVWRKYFDFAAIGDIQAMKRQIHAVRGGGTIAVAGHDIKLGRGGIREIEFFVQTQQLVFGGRRPALRGRGTVAMLAALQAEGWISEAARDELGEAYRHLRTLEHRLQMVRDEQTQRLPARDPDLDGFARFSGYRTRADFEAALLAQARRVQGHYALLFEAGPTLSAETGNLVFTGAETDPDTLATLARLGFREPERVAETVRGWHYGRRPAVRSSRAREALTELVPALLEALAGTPDPDAALDALDRALGRMPAAAELFTILRERERLRMLFADLVGSAPRLAQTVAFSPHVLDALIDPDFAAAGADAGAISERMRGHVRPLSGPGDYEPFLDRLRDGARQVAFLVGARMLSGILTPEEAGQAYAGVADAAVGLALDAVTEAFRAEHGSVPAGRLAVLGYGRLGSRQLTAESDLDLVVLYDFDPEARTSDGRRPLDAAVYCNRLTQRLHAALTVPTRRGRLYEIDLRLRPGGGQGSVATQFRSFRQYQREEAELWEHMALSRARVVAGDASLAAQAGEAIAEALTRPREPAAVNAAVRAMRERVAGEKGFGGPFDLKLAPGGLMDLDFLAQALMLGHAARLPGLIGLPAPEVFARAADDGLLAEADARGLTETYRLLDDVHHWQRLVVEGDPSQASPAALARLARAANLPDARVLAADLDAKRAWARERFERLLADPPP